jgi:DNA-binding NarL/FixJ family response regulator
MRRKRPPSLERPGDPASETTALTPRQRDVAVLLVRTGLSYKQIAAQLDVREGTVRTHVESVYRALDVHSRAELTIALWNWVGASPSAPRQGGPTDSRPS